ncbi:MAG: cytochrome b, partial [Rhodanobacteraceae bacterium]
PFYAIVRMIPAKLPGVLAMFSSIFLLFLVPWLDRGKVKSIRYRGRGYKIALGVFALVFLLLGTIGADKTAEWIPEIFGPDANVTFIENIFGRILVVLYFGFFVFLWVYTYFGFERTKPVPERVTTHD